MVPIREVLEGIWRAVMVARLTMIRTAILTAAAALVGISIVLYHFRPIQGVATVLGAVVAIALIGLEIILCMRLRRMNRLLAGG